MCTTTTTFIFYSAGLFFHGSLQVRLGPLKVAQKELWGLLVCDFYRPDTRIPFLSPNQQC